ncbi:hypothetical protein PITCH_A1740056 [uncultured Desulfobacterium sp.]|uniref:Uncharacterized protein n=1 Tax=uncultured Desulfobacterium sp. TaxID=201089 RepID=A0A445MUS1_9BACT|nr:hypothetical protein PITCH_A1740056 [uncultured Desulfobacterium sp.]
MKRFCFVQLMLTMVLLFIFNSGFCLEDCFNYECMRQDLSDKYGWDELKIWEEKGKDSRTLEKRWPTWQLQLTTEEEKKKYGTTGLELMQKQYSASHSEGYSMRMFVYIDVVHEGGVRKIAGWRCDLNPMAPKEYLDPNFAEDKKDGEDWFMIQHWVHPADTRGTGILVKSPNNKAQENDTWVWFPSLRKERRLTPAGGGDALVGSDLTFAEAYLWRITDEKFQIIGETKFKSFLPVDYYEGLTLLDKYGPNTKQFGEFIKGTVSQSRDCWVVRAIPVKGGYADWYSTRIAIMDKEWGVAYSWDIFDSKQRMMKCYTTYWNRHSDYNGKPHLSPFAFGEAINFENWGFTVITALQSNWGIPVPEVWGSLMELKKSVPSIRIPYMEVLAPQQLAPLEQLYDPQTIEARKKIFPEGRITTFANPTEIVGWDKWVSSGESE